MEAPMAIGRAQEIAAEKRQLARAHVDIEQGRNRLRNQQDLLSSLEMSGRSTGEAERLVQLFKRTLLEWERHRTLIEQRIDYLERTVATA
jgi:two-component system, chemotaxis family, protein-glutamate methylesterase/glutaminase